MVKEYIVEGILLDESTHTLQELCDICMLDENTLIEMIEYGVIEPSGETRQTWVFTGQALNRSKKALRLHHDLAINWQGIALVLSLLDEMEEMRQTLARLQKD